MGVFDIVAWVLLALASVGLLLQIAAVIAAKLHLRPRPLSSRPLPPISLLKPLKGTEDELAANLRSWFEQDYPAPMEIIFAATEADDPGLTLAQRLAAFYPHIPTRFVVADSAFGLNPKVANLAGAMATARHDLVHQSDANVRARPGYLRRIVTELLEEDASILTSVVVGSGERSFGAALENLQLSAFIGPAMCLALKAANITCVCGKSMLLRRSELQTLGGLESVRNVLCEDFVLGERYKAAGHRVLLSPTTIENINRDCGADRFVERHSRWLKMRISLHLPGFCGDLISNPIALATLAALFSRLEGGITLVAIGLAVAKTVLDQAAVRITRKPLPLRYALLTPVKDLMLLPLWVQAIFSRSVVWRGRRLRFGRNTVLIPAKRLPIDAEDPHPAPHSH